jgi:diacylglycerol kinase family enzyme
MTKKRALIYNPSAGGGKALRRKKRVEASLKDNNIDYDLFVTKNEEHLIQTALAVTNDYPVIIGAGGDTTLNIIATQILRSKRDNILGIISLGSVNDLAREFQVHKLDNAIAAIKSEETQTIDIGTISSEGQSESYFFLVSVSLGLGVLVNRYVDTWMRKHPFFSTFRSTLQGTAAISAIRQAFKNREVPLKLKIESDGKFNSVVSPLLVFLNSSCFAGGFYLSPTASPISGKLDCCIFNISSFTNLLKVSIDIKRKKHLETNKIDILKEKSFKIYSENPLEFQIDGEIIKLEGNVNVSLRPRALKVITYNPS